MESSPGESRPEASPALLERAVFRAGSHDDSQRDSPRMRSSVQGHDAQQRQMHMQADAPQVSCRTPVGTAADSDLLSHDDESPPLRLDLFSDAVKPLPEVAGMGELPQVANDPYGLTDKSISFSQGQKCFEMVSYDHSEEYRPFGALDYLRSTL